MTAFSGALTVWIDADTNDEAQRLLDGIGQRSLEHPHVDAVVVSSVEKSTIQRSPREEASHA